jgi:pimeloyl-ACP methyl ester carboxylesterase
MRFVFLHGAWHGGWCFDAVGRELSALGHQVFAPDLPCDDISKSQYDYAAAVGPQPGAIVVGHSLGGLTTSLVEARAHVYLAAILPIEGVFSHALAAEFDGFVRDEQGRSYWPDLETTRTRLYPDCTEEQAALAYACLRPQAPLTPHIGSFGPNDVSIACLRDGAVDPAWQVRAGLEHVGRVIELDAGHSPFLTQPAELAGLLASLA